MAWAIFRHSALLAQGRNAAVLNMVAMSRGKSPQPCTREIQETPFYEGQMHITTAATSRCGG